VCVYAYVKCTIYSLKVKRKFHELLMWWRYTTYTVYVLQTCGSQWKDYDVRQRELDQASYD